MQSPAPSQVLLEAIVFWSIGLFIFVGRLWARAILRNSWKKFQADDYMMMATFGFYTCLLVLLQFSSRYATNEMQSWELPAVLADPKETADRIFGSKIVVGTNQCYLLCLWGVKASLLMLYYKMTRDSQRNRLFVQIVMIYTALGLVFTEIPYFFVLCRPFSGYWAIPVPNEQCANYFHYCIIQMVFNVSSDILLLVIPVPFIVHAKVTASKRAMLAGIFSLGIFVLIAAILNKAYNFANMNTTIYMVWHIRETSTAIYVSNIMCIWPLLRKIFGLKKFIRSNHGTAERKSMPVPILTNAAPIEMDNVYHEKHWDEEKGEKSTFRSSINRPMSY